MEKDLSNGKNLFNDSSINSTKFFMQLQESFVNKETLRTNHFQSFIANNIDDKLDKMNESISNISTALNKASDSTSSTLEAIQSLYENIHNNCTNIY